MDFLFPTVTVLILCQAVLQAGPALMWSVTPDFKNESESPKREMGSFIQVETGQDVGATVKEAKWT